MSEPSNPYESPKQSSQSATTRAVKAGINSVTILILMPLAMFLAFCIGCGLTFATIDTRPINQAAKLFGSQEYTALFLYAGLLSWLPPIGAMIAMLIWRSRVRRKEFAAAGQVIPHEHAQD